MTEILFWLYLANAVLLITHEIDSAYWQEWKMFGIPGGVNGFLILHLPLVFLVLYGLVLVFQQAFSGLIFSLLLSFAGIFAFIVHTLFIKLGREEFRTPLSLGILIASFIVSLAQAAVTVLLMMD
jgi:chromate transport protein ChrA